MIPMECQNHVKCHGWCETDDERKFGLCENCLAWEREEEAERKYKQELRQSIERIALAAGITSHAATPTEIADAVCARLAQSTAIPG